MSYQRVIPRDLFNEAKLLKCLGQVALLIHERNMPTLRIEHADDESFAGFYIEQNLDDGGLYCSNFFLYNGDDIIDLQTVYNSKDNYPLIFSETGERVLDESGEFTTAFLSSLQAER